MPQSSFRIYLCLIMLAWCVQVFAQQQIDIDTNFGDADQPIAYGQGQAKGRITGLMPTGWRENSNWADVDIDYAVQVSEGRKYLRMHLSRLVTGQGQITTSLPEITEDVSCRLTVELRNQSSAPVTLAIRQRGSPYQTIWQSPPLTHGEWEQRTFNFQLNKPGFAVGLYLYAPGKGHVDVMSIKLKAIDERALIQQIRKRYPNHGPANLLRHTTFAGRDMPMGWSMDRDTSDGDEAQVQITRDGALAFSTAEATALVSEPLMVKDPTVRHQAVVQLSGQGRWQLELMNGLKYKTGQAVTLGDQPRAYVLVFDPDRYTPNHQLRFRTDKPGRLIIHELKVGPAMKVDKYQPAGQPIVGLDLPKGDAGAAGVQFDDENPVIQVHTRHAPSGSRMKVVITHGDLQHGETRFLRPMQNQPLNYLVEGKTLLGPYRIEATLIRHGRAVSPTVERIVYRLRRPRYWGRDAPDSAFGVHTLSTHRHNTMAKAIGINWVRLHDAGLNYIGWYFLEPEKGKWTFHDQSIQRYRSHHLMIFGELGTAPHWASYYAKTGLRRDAYHDRFFQPMSMQDYANYVSVVTRRYQGVIHAWDVWNEPWIHAWWAVGYDKQIGGRAGYKPSDRPQEDFVRLMKTAYRTAKRINPKLIIAGFNTTTATNTIDTRFSGAAWTEGVYRAGGLKYSDVLVYHQYTGDSVGHPGDTVEAGLETAFGILKNKNGQYPRPVWMTEGQPLLGRTTHGMMVHTTVNTHPDGYRSAGDRLIRYLVSGRNAGIQRFFLYTMHAHQGIFGNDASQWGIFTQFDGSLHPVGAAMSALAWQIDGLHAKGRLEIVRGVYAYLFAGQGRVVAVVCPQYDAQEWRVPAGSEDIWGNAIQPGRKLANESIFVTGTAAGQLLKKLN